MTLKDYMTTKEAAKAIGCTRVWVWQLIQDKKLKGQKVGSQWFIAPSEVRRYMREQNK